LKNKLLSVIYSSISLLSASISYLFSHLFKINNLKQLNSKELL